MSTVWEDSEELKLIATNIIARYDIFEEDIRANNPKIKYLIKNSKKSKEIGKCSKTSGFWKFLTEYDYVIWVWSGFWDEASIAEKNALVFHELKHILAQEDEETGEIKWKIRDHEVEAFIDEVKEFKDWNIYLSEVRKAFEE